MDDPPKMSNVKIQKSLEVDKNLGHEKWITNPYKALHPRNLTNRYQKQRIETCILL